MNEILIQRKDVSIEARRQSFEDYKRLLDKVEDGSMNEAERRLGNDGISQWRSCIVGSALPAVRPGHLKHVDRKAQVESQGHPGRTQTFDYLPGHVENEGDGEWYCVPHGDTFMGRFGIELCRYFEYKPKWEDKPEEKTVEWLTRSYPTSDCTALLSPKRAALVLSYIADTTWFPCHRYDALYEDVLQAPKPTTFAVTLMALYLEANTISRGDRSFFKIRV
jgi:hypothetical protein